MNLHPDFSVLAEATIATVGVVSSILLILLGWLHVRISSMAGDQRVESRERMDCVMALRAEIYGHLGTSHMSRQEAAAQFQRVVDGMTSLTNRMSDFQATAQGVMDRSVDHTSRIARLEGRSDRDRPVDEHRH